MPLRFPDGFPWWTFPPEKIAKMTVEGRAECRECRGKCCNGNRAPIHYHEDDPGAYIPATEELRTMLRRHGAPMLPTRVTRRADGRVQFAWRCPLHKSGCSPERKPDLCKRFPMGDVSRVQEEVPSWCQLARNLRAEWVAGTQVPGASP